MWVERISGRYSVARLNDSPSGAQRWSGIVEMIKSPIFDNILSSEADAVAWAEAQFVAVGGSTGEPRTN